MRIFSRHSPHGRHSFGKLSGRDQTMGRSAKSSRIAFFAWLTCTRSPRLLIRKNCNPKFSNWRSIIWRSGLNPDKCVLFMQSAVKEHCELAWLLGTVTPMGELKRMTQFKDKSKQHPEYVNAGLFNYPLLMAADILLYKTDGVPIGKDQQQHVELTRAIAAISTTNSEKL